MSNEGRVGFTESINDFTLKELEEKFAGLGIKRFHARQVFFWVYKRMVSGFDRMSDLPRDLRRRLRDEFMIVDLTTRKVLSSTDGTRKLLLDLSDGERIEAVVIPAPGRVTGCVSTQAGCKFKCRFCASGITGFKRDLSVGEIIGQIFCLKRNAPQSRLTHVVFMGTGEPLDNYDNLLKAIRIINTPQAFGIGARRITISSCGIIPGINRLAKEGLQVELSVSLHAADDILRSRIMPVNRKYPLPQLIAACESYAKVTGRQVTFEYILIKGVNSDLRNARQLGKIISGINSKVNLIPANNIKELNIAPPDMDGIIAFRDCLKRAGVGVTLRKERGADIQAACGQLRIRHENK